MAADVSAEIATKVPMLALAALCTSSYDARELTMAGPPRRG